MRFQNGNLLLEVVELAQLLGFVDLHPEPLVQLFLDFGALLHLLPELLEGFQGLRCGAANVLGGPGGSGFCLSTRS